MKGKKKRFDTVTLRRVVALVAPERGYLAAGLLFAAAEQYALAHMDKPLNSLKFLRSLSAWDPDQQPKKD